MNEKSCLNEVAFIFAVQSCFWKILNFLTQARVWHGFQVQVHRFVIVTKPRRLGLDSRYLSIKNMSNLINNKWRTIVHFSYQGIEKKEKMQIIDHRRQSNHYLSIRATPYERKDLDIEKCRTRLFNDAGATHSLEKKKKVKKIYWSRITFYISFSFCYNVTRNWLAIEKKKSIKPETR